MADIDRITLVILKEDGTREKFPLRTWVGVPRKTERLETPSQMRRASSMPEMTRTSMLASSRTRSMNSSRLSASRTAEVASAIISRA